MNVDSKIVQYSDSDTDDDDPLKYNVNERKESRKRKWTASNYREDTVMDRTENTTKFLPVPDDVLSMFQEVKEETVADQDGKIRSFARVEGDWPSFVFIPVKACKTLKQLINILVEKLKDEFPNLKANGVDGLHITLSRTVSLRHYWIEPIVSQLKDIFSNMQSFKCHLDIIEFYTNDEKTRSFFGLRIILGEEKLKFLAKKVDKVLAEFGLPKYYENPSFHISFAWHTGDVTAWVKREFLEGLQDLLDSFNVECSTDESSLGFRTLNIEAPALKTGKKVYCLQR